jgi:hypothetical protein
VIPLRITPKHSRYLTASCNTILSSVTFRDMEHLCGKRSVAWIFMAPVGDFTPPPHTANRTVWPVACCDVILSYSELYLAQCLIFGIKKEATVVVFTVYNKRFIFRIYCLCNDTVNSSVYMVSKYSFYVICKT